MTGKEGPIMSKWIYKSVPAFSNYFNVEWIMSLLGFMIFIGHQSRMGCQMYAWKQEGIFYYPASVYPSRQSSCIRESANNIFSTTTRSIRSKTVIYYDDAQYSDASMFWKRQDPTENDTSNDADIIRWHSFATKKHRCNVDNDVTDSCGTPVKTMSKQENPNADQRLQGGTRLPLHMTFKPLEHNLLCMTAHAVFAATAHAFADTKRNKNQDEQAKTCIAHAVFASDKDGVSHMQYSRLAHRQLSLIGRQRRQTRSGASMARGPRLFSPAVQSAPWSYQSTSNNAQMMPMPDIRLKFISGSYPPRHAACSTKPQRIVSNLRVLFLQMFSARRIWDITQGCSTLRPRRMKTSTSSSRTSLVGHLELLRKEPAQEEDYNKPTHHAMSARVYTSKQTKPMPKLSVNVFGPNSRSALDQSKTRWDKDRFGRHNQRPKIYDQDAVYRVKAIQGAANSWDDDQLSMSSKNSPTQRAQETTLSDVDQLDERIRIRKEELVRHAESLLSITKSLDLYKSEPDINEEDDRTVQFPEVMSTDENDHGRELENDPPPDDAGNVQAEPVRNEPPQTRTKTRKASRRYPEPIFSDDFEDDGPLYDSYGVLMRTAESVGDSSNQATATSNTKPIPRIVISTPRTATSRAPKAGTSAPPKGKASGASSASSTYGPPSAAAHAAAMLADWPPIPAPGATILDQHDDAPRNATTRQDDAFGAHPGDL